MSALGSVAVFASGSGTTFAYLFDEGRGEIEFTGLFCDRADAGVIEKARERGVRVIPVAKDGAWKRELAALAPDLICLAGYLRTVPPDVIEAFRGRILNVHPALLPKFGGKGFYGRRVHEAVILSGESESGASVHLVDEGIDTGRVLAQARVRVAPEMDAEALEERVQAVEKPLYLETIRKVLEEKHESTDQRL